MLLLFTFFFFGTSIEKVERQYVWGMYVLFTSGYLFYFLKPQMVWKLLWFVYSQDADYPGHTCLAQVIFSRKTKKITNIPEYFPFDCIFS